jgi:hypothetical protein
MPSLTPRQIRILADSRNVDGGQSGNKDDLACNSTGSSTLREIDPPYLYRSKRERRRKREQAETYSELIQTEGLSPDTTCTWPSWQTSLRKQAPTTEDEGNSAIHFDSNFQTGDELDAMWSKLQSEYVSAGSANANGSSIDSEDD